MASHSTPSSTTSSRCSCRRRRSGIRRASWPISPAAARRPAFSASCSPPASTPTPCSGAPGRRRLSSSRSPWTGCARSLDSRNRCSGSSTTPRHRARSTLWLQPATRPVTPRRNAAASMHCHPCASMRPPRRTRRSRRRPWSSAWDVTACAPFRSTPSCAWIPRRSRTPSPKTPRPGCDRARWSPPPARPRRPAWIRSLRSPTSAHAAACGCTSMPPTPVRRRRPPSTAGCWTAPSARTRSWSTPTSGCSRQWTAACSGPAGRWRCAAPSRWCLNTCARLKLPTLTRSTSWTTGSRSDGAFVH